MTFTIGIVSDRVEPYFFGGYEHQIYNLATALSAREEVHVYTSLEKMIERKDNITFHKIITNNFKASMFSRNYYHSMLFSLLLSFKVRNIIKNDIIIFEAIPYLHLLLFPLFSIFRRQKLVLKIDEAWFSYTDKPGFLGKLELTLIKLLIKIALKYSDLVIVNNTPTSDTLIYNFGMNNEKIIIAPLALNLKRILNYKISSSIKKYDAIYVGRLSSIKHVEDLIRASYNLKKNYFINLSVAVVGDGEQMKWLKRLTLSLNLDVTFFGYVEEQRKFQLLSESKFFVLPSIREGLSISTLEAQFSGIPCIVAEPLHREVFGPSDFIKDNYNGLYYKAGDVDDLTEKIFYLMKNPEEISRLSLNALNDFNGYDFDFLANKIINRMVTSDF